MIYYTFILWKKYSSKLELVLMPKNLKKLIKIFYSKYFTKNLFNILNLKDDTATILSCQSARSDRDPF